MGVLVGKMVAGNALIVLNQGRELTFRLLDASPQAQASQGFDELEERPVGGPTSRMPRNTAEIHPIKG